jgi:hypothetical protein
MAATQELALTRITLTRITRRAREPLADVGISSDPNYRPAGLTPISSARILAIVAA